MNMEGSLTFILGQEKVKNEQGGSLKFILVKENVKNEHGELYHVHFR